ncbi:class I SAM-dependent methyltransferase [Nitrosomonas sp. HPC101]|uniref:class I SAM-dependent methyltransferase n=1 Tax=Nitrosomonas sp. HPC101 TaxID=1658667 RepID=UPI00136E1E4A|nr:class I SAM-dependent methyltransferase [Nitrosomonas sp. HPC101]MXS86048.1 class I SAM-dependent methyltransferase [Nitrosomonas sp. HPC101]
MGFMLDKVVPWGRSYYEYVSMFNLTNKDLSLRFLGCGDGPAAFNSMLTKRGGSVVSVDPIYVFNTTQIRSRVAETYETVIAQMRKNQDDYVWENIPSVEQLGKIRMSAMEDFFSDFSVGKQNGRYVAGELPSLPFESKQFDIAVSSHFLFLYSAHLSVEFHIQTLQEMLRVAHEIRIFPLLALDGASSPYLKSVNEYFLVKGLSVNTIRVPYEFQRDGNEMLVIKSV